MNKAAIAIVAWLALGLQLGLAPALEFGSRGVAPSFVIPLIAVHMGLRTTGGAEGVGRATTSSVVFMIIAVLVSDATFPPLFLN